jgi:hypothetical protein
MLLHMNDGPTELYALRLLRASNSLSRASNYSRQTHLITPPCSFHVQPQAQKPTNTNTYKHANQQLTPDPCCIDADANTCPGRHAATLLSLHHSILEISNPHPIIFRTCHQTYFPCVLRAITYGSGRIHTPATFFLNTYTKLPCASICPGCGKRREAFPLPHRRASLAIISETLQTHTLALSLHCITRSIHICSPSRETLLAHGDLGYVRPILPERFLNSGPESLELRIPRKYSVLPFCSSMRRVDASRRQI